MPGERPAEYLEMALGEARGASARGEVPIGAALALPGGRVFRAGNGAEEGSPLDHAEMLCLRAALAAVGRDGLGDSTLYVTAEPCLMCLGAMVHARIGGLVYACPEPRFGGISQLQALWKEGRYPHRFPIAHVPSEEAVRLLQEFFARRR